MTIREGKEFDVIVAGAGCAASARLCKPAGAD